MLTKPIYLHFDIADLEGNARDGGGGVYCTSLLINVVPSVNLKAPKRVFLPPPGPRPFSPLLHLIANCVQTHMSSVPIFPSYGVNDNRSAVAFQNGKPLSV